MILLRKRMTEKEFLIKLEKVHGDKYSLMQHHPFTSSINKITLKCNICKRYFSNIPYNIIYSHGGAGCYYCSKNHKLSTSEAFQQINSIDKNYFLISKFKGSSKNISIYHNKCGFIFTTTFNKFKHRGKRCPHCEMYVPKGERLLKSILNKMNINYIYQYKPKGLKRIYQLSYDFYLPDYNILIEYQGEQHYKPVPFGGDIESAKIKFRNQIKNDNIKRYYADTNNIKLIEIPYKLSKINIESLIKSSVKQSNLTHV